MDAYGVGSLRSRPAWAEGWGRAERGGRRGKGRKTGKGIGNRTYRKGPCTSAFVPTGWTWDGSWLSEPAACEISISTACVPPTFDWVARITLARDHLPATPPPGRRPQTLCPPPAAAAPGGSKRGSAAAQTQRKWWVTGVSDAVMLLNPGVCSFA